jgi:anti-sigma regulatory factor (Ser/Thr protein kinase)
MQREESHAGPGRLQLELSPDIDAPASARRALRTLPLGERELDVLLLASEVVANAVVHGAAPTMPIVLSATCEEGRTRVEILHHGTPQGVAELSGGYGLQVLAGASERWGIEHDGFTRVWFEVGR